MQRNIYISSFVLFFVQSFTVLNILIFFAREAFERNFFMLKTMAVHGLSGISSGLFNSNHSQYLKKTVYQYYHKEIDSKAVSLYFGQLLNNH